MAEPAPVDEEAAWPDGPCPDCDGKGSVYAHACKRCGGTGDVYRVPDRFCGDCEGLGSIATADHSGSVKEDRCAPCAGTGMLLVGPGAREEAILFSHPPKRVLCPECLGDGEVPAGFYVSPGPETCPECGGDGAVPFEEGRPYVVCSGCGVAAYSDASADVDEGRLHRLPGEAPEAKVCGTFCVASFPAGKDEPGHLVPAERCPWCPGPRDGERCSLCGASSREVFDPPGRAVELPPYCDGTCVVPDREPCGYCSKHRVYPGRPGPVKLPPDVGKPGPCAACSGRGVLPESAHAQEECCPTCYGTGVAERAP